MPKNYANFAQRFDLYGSYIDVQLEYELDQDTFDKYLPYNLKFTTPFFEYSMSDINYSNFIDNFLTRYGAGGNSYSSIHKSSDGQFLRFSNYVSGSGGDSNFEMSLPMNVATQIYDMLRSCEKEANATLND